MPKSDEELLHAIPSPATFLLTLPGKQRPSIAVDGSGVRDLIVVAFDAVNAAIGEVGARINTVVGDGRGREETIIGDSACRTWRSEDDGKVEEVEACVDDTALQYRFVFRAGKVAGGGSLTTIASAFGTWTDSSRSGHADYDFDALRATAGEEATSSRGRLEINFRADAQARSMLVRASKFASEGRNIAGLIDYRLHRDGAGRATLVAPSDLVRRARGELERGPDGRRELSGFAAVWAADGATRAEVTTCVGQVCTALHQCWNPGGHVGFESFSRDTGRSRPDWSDTQCTELDAVAAGPAGSGESR